MAEIIDGHVHLYPPEINRDPAGWAAAQGEPHWAAQCTRRRRDGSPVQGFPSLDELLRAMDAAGVGRAVLLGWYWQSPGACARHNRFYADCLLRHPDRLAAFAALHPGAGREATLAELARARAEGFSGVGELSPHAQGYACDDPVLGEALAQAGAARFPVNLHVTDPEGRAYPGRVPTPAADFLALARAFPATRFVLAHWGGAMALRDPDAAAQPNFWYDTAASPLLYAPDIWKRFAAAAGWERVIFGSDFPLNLYPRDEDTPELGRLLAEARSELTGDQQKAVLGDNLRRLLGVENNP